MDKRRTTGMVKTKAARKRFPDSMILNVSSSSRRRSSSCSSSSSNSSGGSSSSSNSCSEATSPSGSEGSHSMAPTRRTIRPVDRQKMLDWLLDKLNNKEMDKYLWWVEKGKVFSVRWPHAASHSFAKEDAILFKAWAEHTGLYKEGDPEADHRKWKANFRCAIHSLPDVEEKKNKDGRKGPRACRVYQILEKPIAKKKKTSCRSQAASADCDKGDDSDNGSSSTVEGPLESDLPLPVTRLIQESDADRVNDNIPDFQKIGMPIIQHNHLSGGCIVRQEAPSTPSIAYHTLSFYNTTSPSSAGSMAEDEDISMDGMLPVAVMEHIQLEKSPSVLSEEPISPPLEQQQLEEEELTAEELEGILDESIGAFETIDSQDITQGSQLIIPLSEMSPSAWSLPFAIRISDVLSVDMQ